MDVKDVSGLEQYLKLIEQHKNVLQAARNAKESVLGT